jgi:hypothetical protein
MGEYVNSKVEEAPFPLTDIDKWVLSLSDEEYQYHTWDELRDIIVRHVLRVDDVLELIDATAGVQQALDSQKKAI